MSDGKMKSFVGRSMTKQTKFMGEDIKIRKLSVAQVLEIQAQAKNIEKNEEEGFNVLKTVIVAGVEGASELTEEDFKNLPLDELSRLSGEIMKFSGIGGEQGK